MTALSEIQSSNSIAGQNSLSNQSSTGSPTDAFFAILANSFLSSGANIAQSDTGNGDFSLENLSDTSTFSADSTQNFDFNADSFNGIDLQSLLSGLGLSLSDLGITAGTTTDAIPLSAIRQKLLNSISDPNTGLLPEYNPLSMQASAAGTENDTNITDATTLVDDLLGAALNFLHSMPQETETVSLTEQNLPTEGSMDPLSDGKPSFLSAAPLTTEDDTLSAQSPMSSLLSLLNATEGDDISEEIKSLLSQIKQQAGSQTETEQVATTNTTTTSTATAAAETTTPSVTHSSATTTEDATQKLSDLIHQRLAELSALTSSETESETTVSDSTLQSLLNNLLEEEDAMLEQVSNVADPKKSASVTNAQDISQRAGLSVTAESLLSAEKENSKEHHKAVSAALSERAAVRENDYIDAQDQKTGSVTANTATDAQQTKSTTSSLSAEISQKASADSSALKVEEGDPVTIKTASTDFTTASTDEDFLPVFGNTQAANTNATEAAKQTGLAQQFRPAFYQTPVEQVNVQVKQAMETGESQIRIQLKPANLGAVDISMQISDDGQLSAMIKADKPETLDMLRNDRSILEKALAESGFDTGSDGLSFSLNDQSAQQQQASADQQGSSSNFTPFNEAISADTETGTEVASNDTDNLSTEILTDLSSETNGIDIQV